MGGAGVIRDSSDRGPKGLGLGDPPVLALQRLVHGLVGDLTTSHSGNSHRAGNNTGANHRSCAQNTSMSDSSNKSTMSDSSHKSTMADSSNKSTMSESSDKTTPDKTSSNNSWVHCSHKSAGSSKAFQSNTSNSKTTDASKTAKSKTSNTKSSCKPMATNKPSSNNTWMHCSHKASPAKTSHCNPSDTKTTESSH